MARTPKRILTFGRTKPDNLGHVRLPCGRKVSIPVHVPPFIRAGSRLPLHALLGIGPFEFAELARVANIEMVLTTKASGYNGSEFADLLDYCYGDQSTEWGAQRIADGYADPFTFSYFELGMRRVRAVSAKLCG